MPKSTGETMFSTGSSLLSSRRMHVRKQLLKTQPMLLLLKQHLFVLNYGNQAEVSMLLS